MSKKTKNFVKASKMAKHRQKCPKGKNVEKLSKKQSKMLKNSSKF